MQYIWQIAKIQLFIVEQWSEGELKEWMVPIAVKECSTLELFWNFMKMGAKTLSFEHSSPLFDFWSYKTKLSGKFWREYCVV